MSRYQSRLPNRDGGDIPSDEERRNVYIKAIQDAWDACNDEPVRNWWPEAGRACVEVEDRHTAALHQTVRECHRGMADQAEEIERLRGVLRQWQDAYRDDIGKVRERLRGPKPTEEP